MQWKRPGNDLSGKSWAVVNESSIIAPAARMSGAQDSQQANLHYANEVDQMTTEGQRLAEFADAIRESTMKRLEQVPAGFENWRPLEASLSIAEIAAHVADADRWLFRKLESPDLAPMTARVGEVENIDRGGFIAMLDRLRQSGQQRSDLMRGLTEDRLAEQTLDQRFAGKVTIWWLLVRGNLDHEIHHRGQLSVYLRLLKHKERV